MKIIEKFRNLKLAAKRACVLLMIVSLISTATGIGSIFVYAEPGDETTLENQTPTENTESTENNTETSEQSTPAGDDSNSTENNTSGDGTTPSENTTPAGDNTSSDNTTPAGDNTSSDNTTPTEGGTPPENTTPVEGTTPTEGSTPSSDTTTPEGTTPAGNTTGTEGTTGSESGTNPEGITGTTENTNADGTTGTKGTTEGTTETTGTPADHIHEYSYTPNDDDTHTKKCTVEGCTEEEVTEPCTFTDGICEFCKASKTFEAEEPDHEHIYIYTPNEDGTTHTKKCTVEGCTEGEIIENCVFEDGKCKFCEAPDPNETMELRRGLLTSSPDEPPITYDGSSEAKTEYYYNVKIKAEGWEVKLKDDPDTAYAAEYVHSQLGHNQVLVLKFRNLADPTKTFEKEITVSIVGAPTTPLKFNGAELKDSYTTSVTITCDGYAIAGQGSSDFASSYTVPYDPLGGTHEEVIQLKNAAGITPVKININFSGDVVPPVISEITTTKTTTGTTFSLRGTDSGSGINNFYVIARVKDGTEKEPSIPEFVSPGGTDIAMTISASMEDTGIYYGSDTLTGLSEDKTYIFYVLADDNASNYSEVRSKVGYSQEISIDIAYNKESLKSWYNADVHVTAEGYMISEAAANMYHTEYVFTGTGALTKKLDFRRITTGVVKTYDITVNIDRSAPAATISTWDYESNKFVTGDAVAFYSNNKEDIKIEAKDDISGVEVINYFISETNYNNVSDLLNGITAEKKAWRTYSSSAKLTLVEDKNNYIFVKVTDKAGNISYISTGRVVCDTTAPSISTLMPSAENNGQGTKITFAGTDELSGINRFKLIYKEKSSDKITAPTKDEIFNLGQYVEVNVSDGTTYGATVTLNNLDPTKLYVFFGAAVDRAGNVSDVMAYEATSTSQEAAAAASAAAAGGAGAGGAAAGGPGGAGLAAAPSGIAGSGNSAGSGGRGGNGSGSSSSATSQGSSSSSPLDREINRQPYIADATGNTKIGLAATGGWNNIVSEIKKADYNSTIDIEMSGLSEIPSGAIEAMAGKPVTVSFRMPQDVEWVLDGEKVEESAAQNIDLGVKVGSKDIPQNVLDDVTESNPHYEFEIAHDGPLGFTATLVFPVGQTNAGLYANLYHYNEDKKDLTLEGTAVVNSDGYAEFDVSHASSFTVVVTSIPLMSNRPEIITTGDQSLLDSDALSSSDVLIRVPDLFGLRGQVRLYLFLIGIICAVLCVMILFLPSLQLQKKTEESVFDFKE